MADPLEQTEPYDITVWQGKSWALQFALYATAEGESGQPVTGDPIPLDGYSVRGQIRPYPGGSLFAEFTATIDTATDTVSLSLSPEQTRQVTRPGVYDVELVSGSNVVGVLHGDVKTIPEVTIP